MIQLHGKKILSSACAFLLGIALAPGSLRAEAASAELTTWEKLSTCIRSSFSSLRAEAVSAELATVDEKSITEADIENQIKGQLLRLNNQIYSLKKQAVDSIVNTHLLEEEAKKRGITRQQLRQQEVTDKTAPVTAAEVVDYYNKNKARFGEKKLEEVQAQLKQSLQAHKQQQRQQAFEAELRKAATISFSMQPPIVDVPTAGSPTKGPPDAPITLVEFSDYQ